MSPYEFANAYLQPYKVHGSEIIPTLCPYCKGGSKQDKHSFALNTDNKTFNCKRGSCGKQGHFTQLCKDFGEQADRDEEYTRGKTIMPFKRPTMVISEAKETVWQYLSGRGITEATAKRRGVGEVNGAIAFPYFENGEIVLLKFRKAEQYEGSGRKAWREDGGKSVLWGMELCEDGKPLTIVEGEYDALALDECWIENVVSVPSGASDLTWVDNCWDFLQRFDKIIFWGDNDEPGQKMVKECILRIGADRCFTVESKYKDANESLLQAGKEQTVKQWENAKPVPVVGLIDLSEVAPVDVIRQPKVLSGIKSIDHDIFGFLFGELSVWSGKSGQGKSTILSQIMLNSIQFGYQVCAYSGELRADRFQYWVNLQAAGRRNITEYVDSTTGKSFGTLQPQVTEQIKAWYKGKFWLYDNAIAGNNEETSVLKVFAYAAKRYGCKVFLVDNLMTSRFNTKSDSDFYRAQSNFVGELVHFAKAFNCHVHLVAHPKKTKDGIEKDDISGTSDIANRADNVFTVDRVENEPFSTVVTCLKNRSFGVQNVKYGMNFDMLSKRFWGHSDTGGEGFSYGWEVKQQTKSIFDSMEGK